MARYWKKLPQLLSGMPADSIVYMVQFDDDEDGLTYKVSGFRRTGFPADDF